jgi:ElaB/YqjD/DUF883 family membrane-anchored ribosome-binding protein
MFNRIAGLSAATPSLASAKEALQQRQRDLARACKQTEELVVQNPAAALAVALAVGVAIGWWLKRM